jgi:hypothetical protein
MDFKSRLTGIVCLGLMAGTSAMADEVFTTTVDSTIDGNAGTILTIENAGGPTEAFFVFPQAQMIRVYASRDEGSPTWDILTGSVSLVPKNKFTAGDTWRFLDDELGGETVAVAVAEESVTTAAGTFTAWKVDVALVTNPTQPTQSLWFAAGVGLVRPVDYLAQWIETASSLDTYSTTGNGYFPLVVGNTWTYVESEVPTAGSSVGEIKARYAN